ncbi:hypothetical protein BESB_038480 [Besnoitia besnoiti]|uniref:Uncharacterized protein n=1 Tax=Besnoitia besnoiti TaxID=94643 RepID=A0A2A9MNS8_BESBE|nr:hypothetical protein BESB_038480 [Besnoitia besnoiti]PFH37390.1 hypothetical protein BESB_038480 [Besnoitia besnoiti]
MQAADRERFVPRVGKWEGRVNRRAEAELRERLRSLNRGRGDSLVGSMSWRSSVSGASSAGRSAESLAVSLRRRDGEGSSAEDGELGSATELPLAPGGYADEEVDAAALAEAATDENTCAELAWKEMSTQGDFGHALVAAAAQSTRLNTELRELVGQFQAHVTEDRQTLLELDRRIAALSPVEDDDEEEAPIDVPAPKKAASRSVSLVASKRDMFEKKATTAVFTGQLRTKKVSSWLSKMRR